MQSGGRKMIIYQRSAGARFPFGIQVIFHPQMTQRRFLKADERGFYKAESLKLHSVGQRPT